MYRKSEMTRAYPTLFYFKKKLIKPDYVLIAYIPELEHGYKSPG